MIMIQKLSRCQSMSAFPLLWRSAKLPSIGDQIFPFDILFDHHYDDKVKSHNLALCDYDIVPAILLKMRNMMLIIFRTATASNVFKIIG